MIGEIEMKVQCNWCEEVFDEEGIIVKSDVEHCPKCNEAGYLMDLKDSEEVKR